MLGIPLIAGRAEAQSRSSTAPHCRDGYSRGSQVRVVNADDRVSNFVSLDNKQCFRAEMRGDVSVTDDDADLRLGPDSYALLLQETNGVERQLEARTDASGHETRTYTVDDKERPSSEAAAWLQATLLGVVRETGFAADKRVERLWRSGGAQAVLNEVDQIPGEGVKRIYLMDMLRRGELRRADLEQLARRVSRFKSDGEKRIVLNAVTEQREAPVDDILQAARTISSDGETRIVLNRVLERTSLDARQSAMLLDITQNIQSDGERRIVLNSAVRRVPLDDSAVRAAFFKSVDGINSAGERRIVLSSVLDRDSLAKPTFIALLHSAAGMDSGGEKAIVLERAAHRSELRDSDIRAAFNDAAKTISSRGEYERVMRAVGQ